jgi:hypothetical protein
VENVIYSDLGAVKEKNEKREKFIHINLNCRTMVSGITRERKCRRLKSVCE